MVIARDENQSHRHELLTGDAVWCGMRQAYLAVTHGLDLELRTAHRLPLGEFELLRALSHPGCAQRMGGLASTVGLSPSGLTRAIERLTARGLVQRVACQDDRRGAMAMLTPAGEALLQEADATHAAALQRLLLDRLSEAESAQLMQIWQRVTGHEIRGCFVDDERTAHHDRECGMAALEGMTDQEGQSRTHD
jgi:DNA-binding MarR family transcriptional regulator